MRMRQAGVVTTAPPTTRITPRSFYRVVAIAEAITWTMLIAGLLLKYVFDAGDLWVRIGGSIHGFVFLAYAATAVLVGVNQRWRVGLIAFGVVTAIVPYATIPFDRWLERNSRLDGEWRTQATDDPRDHTWIDRLLRWFLNHPVVLGALLVVGVAVIFTVLVIIGPPGGATS
jgi:integral membrane protein